MTFMNILKKISILIVAVLSLELTRMGISYLTILIAIGIVMPIICGNKKSAVFTGVLYATISYILTYPSSLFLIDYMPSESIPITVPISTVYSNIFFGWIIPVIIAIVVCGIFSIFGHIIKKQLLDKVIGKGSDEHYFDESNVITPNNNNSLTNQDYQKTTNTINNNQDYPRKTNSLNKNEKKELLYLTPIQKAKNRNKRKNE